MSYCQKHRNHHCVHSHTCKDPSHKSKKRNNSQSLKNKSATHLIPSKYKPPLGTIQDNEQCHFQQTTKHHNHFPSSLNIQIYTKKIQQLKQQLQKRRRNELNLQIQNRKLKQRNSHVQCQIQYLRQQLNLLVQNHNTDISKEIKKNLIENTKLNIKIKQLMSEILDKGKKIQELESMNYSVNRKNRQLEKSIAGLEDKIKVYSNKNQELCFQNNDYQNKLKAVQMELKLVKDKFDLLSASINNESKEKQKKVELLSNSNQKLQKLIKTKEFDFKSKKQLFQIEKNGLQKLIEQLKQNLFKKQDECKKNITKAKQAQENYNQLKQDFQHAKNIILKYQNLKDKTQKIKEDIKDKISFNQQSIDENNKKTIQNINKRIGQTENQKNKINFLKKQNLQLKNKIYQLQAKLNSQLGPLTDKKNLIGNNQANTPANIIINEELILSIGASNQFKKIIQQKNTIIKQLMKQKSQLYNKIYQQQAYLHH